MSKDKAYSFSEGLPCCKTEPDNDGNDRDKDCRDNWQARYERAERKYKRANARHDKYNGIHQAAAAWEAKLQGWFDDLCAAQLNAEKISALLKILIAKTGKTVQNAHATRKTAEAALCLVRDIFECIYDLVKTHPPDDEAGLIQILKDEINCDPILDETKKMEITGCIDRFESAIKEAQAMQKEVLEELLLILNCANLLVGYLQKRGGLKWQLQDIQKRIAGAAHRNQGIRHLCYEDDWEVVMDDDDDDKDEPIKYKEPKEYCKVDQPPCGTSVYKPDQKLFPIERSAYFTKVENLLEQAKKDTECLEDKKERAAEKKALAEDRQNQYKKAVDASNMAETGS